MFNVVSSSQKRKSTEQDSDSQSKNEILGVGHYK